MAATSSPTWTSWREALKVVSQPSHLKKTAALAFVFGTIFFAINQLASIRCARTRPGVRLQTTLRLTIGVYV
jgi:hypothetical protein